MTPKQIELVQASWKKIVPIADDAATLFYDKLFSLDPALRPLFKGEMTKQGRKLMQMVSTAVESLGRIEALSPVLRDLGRRHRAYGVHDKDYKTVSSALLWTLGRGLGSAFTAEVEEAWIAVYGVLARTMKGEAPGT